MAAAQLGAWVKAPLIQRVLREFVLGAERINLDKETAPELFEDAGEDANTMAWAQLDEAVSLGWFDLQYRRSVRMDDWSRVQRRPFLLANDRTRHVALEHCTDAECVKARQRELAWAKAVAEHPDLTDEDRELLAVNPLKAWTLDRAPCEVIEALLAFRRQPDFHLFEKEASARHFWGMSKVVGRFRSFFTEWLRVPELPYRVAKEPLLVQLPARRLGGVLLIENLTTYESSCELARARAMGMSGPDVFNELALVYSGGKRALSGSSELRISVADAEKPFAASWVGHIGARLAGTSSDLPVYFWGDLDHAGMEMLRCLNEQVPAAGAWWPGYAPMVQALSEGGGHVPEAAEKLGQNRGSARPGCPIARHLLIPAIETTGRYLDQGFVDLRALAPVQPPLPA